MKVSQSITTAVKALFINKSRSILTMLGIIIGISSVIIILSVGASAQNLILDQVKRIGSNLIVIFPGQSEENGPPVSVLGIQVTSLVAEDLEALLDPTKVTNTLAATGYVRGNGTMTFRGEVVDSTFLGVSAEYMNVEDSTLEQGRFFYEDEDRSLARVAVLGSELKNNLFGDQNPVGQKIKIKNEFFEVIGYMKERGPVAFQNPDQYALIPMRTAQKIMLGIDHLSFARVKAADSESIDFTIEQVRQTLREQHDIRDEDPDDFTIRTTQQALGVLTTITNSVKFFLGAVAAISLVVGGVGIMNIMFVAITERTQEIGLRKAIGAPQSSIVRQFVVEAMILSLIGGVVGVLFGAAISYLIALIVTNMDYAWDFVIAPQSILMAVGFSLAIGFIFGTYPAYKASKLNPIEALRYE